MKNIISVVKDFFTSAKNEGNSSSSAGGRRVFFGPDDEPTSENARKIATVFSCINIKANALAVMPIKIYESTPSGKKEKKELQLYEVLRYSPKNNLPASLYKKMISQDLDLRGNHYSQILRNGLGEIVALYPLVADKMQVGLLKNEEKVYIYDNRVVESSKILHIFDIPDNLGLKGLSRIEHATQSLTFAKNASEFGNKMFKNATTPSGSFEIPDVLDDEAYERLKKDIEEKYTDLEKAGVPLLLEGGLTFKSLSIKNSDAEWLASRKFNREELASIFGVPVAMLNDATNTAYGNLEQKYLEFFSGTIYPLTTIIEESMRMSLLNQKQKQTLSIKFKYNALLRVDTKTRADYYKTRFDIGSITPNEIREYEDENKINSGDEAYVQLNLSTLKNINKAKND